MCGSTVMGVALKRIGYPMGFAAAGSVALVALVLFYVVMRKKRRFSNDAAGTNGII